MIGKLLKIVKSWFYPASKMKLSAEKTPVQNTAVDEHNNNAHSKPDQKCEVAVTKEMEPAEHSTIDNHKQIREADHEKDTNNKNETIQQEDTKNKTEAGIKSPDQKKVPKADHNDTDNKDENIQREDARNTTETGIKSPDQKKVPEADHNDTDNKDETIQREDARNTTETGIKSPDQKKVPKAEDFFHYQDETFSFSIPWNKDEKEVFQQATEKYEETKKRLDNSTKKMDQHKIQRARYMQYWSLHLYYKDQAQYFYKKRDQEPDALKQAIQYCKKQVKYAPMARHALQMDPSFKGELPQHYGYKQLAIIYDKQGQYTDAIQLCRQALSEGWKGDWEARIQRYEKNLKS